MYDEYEEEWSTLETVTFTLALIGTVIAAIAAIGQRTGITDIVVENVGVGIALLIP